MSDKDIQLNIDGQKRVFRVPVNTSLVTLLRQAQYRGLRQACDGGNCGGCTVLIDRRPVLSCLMHACQAEGREILTITGVIALNEDLEKLPLCFRKQGGYQCGFCTCGFIMATAGLYFRNRNPSRREIVRGLSGNLCRCTGYEKILRSAELFFQVINGRAQLEAADDTAKPFGQGVVKVDGEGLTTGRSHYVTDRMGRPDQAVLKLLPSTKAHAKILKIDPSDAEKMTGVFLVLTHENVPDIRFTTAAQEYPEPSPRDRRLLDDRVRHYGEPVAAVVAADEETAEAALRVIRVEYEELPVMLGFEDAYFETKTPVHEEGPEGVADASRNLVTYFDYQEGRMEWPGNMLVFEKRFETSRQQHVHLEPHAAVAYPDDRNRLVVCASTQVPFDVRRTVCRVLGLPSSRLRVIKPRVGGGFGGKQEVTVELLTALAAYRLQRPVFCRMSRKEEFAFAPTRHPFRIDLKLGFSRDGTLVNLEAHVLSDTGAYGGHGSTVLDLGLRGLMDIYRTPNIKISGRVIYTNRVPSGAFRGFGVPQLRFALESLVDEAAHALNMDPARIRGINHIREGDHLRVETLLVKPFVRGERVDTCPLPELIEEGKGLIEWEQRREPPEGGLTGKGMGITFQESGIPNNTRSSVTASLNEDGTVQLLTGAADIGTGADTVLTQIAAQTLEIPMSAIHLVSGDTAVTPYDSGAYASNTTYVAGTAVKDVCEKMKASVLDHVANSQGIDRRELILREGFVTGGGRRLAFSEIARSLYTDVRPVQTVFHSVAKKKTSAPSFAATFVDIDVDRITGRVTVIKVVQVIDCGMVVNPVLAEGQVEGSTLQAMGYALYEELTCGPGGRVKEMDLLSYKIPTIFEKPEIIVRFIQKPDPTGPFGAKAAGEVAFASVPAAIQNAVRDACGFPVESLPITPEKVLRELKTAVS